MTDKKKKVKLAMIRTNKDKPRCPFGLPIPYGCKNAGELIDKMFPVELAKDLSDDEKADIIKANKRLLVWEEPCQRCRFAGKVMEDQKAAECNWGSNAPGIMNEKGLLGSPFYSKVYNNVSYDGLYSYPMGYYGDGNISRNLYYGIYSLQGSVDQDLAKFAQYLNDLNDNFDELLPEHQELLVSFAQNYANNGILVKKANNNVFIDKIYEILNVLKDLS